MIKIFIYVLSVVVLNFIFAVIPMVTLPDGNLWSVGSLLAGFVFIARDYAQRDAGNMVVPAMLMATVISYFMASPFIAIASASAFAVSESIDWCIYTKTKKPFKDRVIISSIFACPTDTIVFLALIDQLSVLSFAVMTASKFISILWVVRFAK